MNQETFIKVEVLQSNILVAINQQKINILKENNNEQKIKCENMTINKIRGRTVHWTDQVPTRQLPFRMFSNKPCTCSSIGSLPSYSSQCDFPLSCY